jgi:hypothetical protein
MPSVIVTNIHPSVFESAEEKLVLERLMASYGQLTEPVIWLKSFSRAIFTYSTAEEAATVKEQLDRSTHIHGNLIRVFLSDVCPYDIHLHYATGS